MTEPHRDNLPQRASGMNLLRVLLVYLGGSLAVLEGVDLLSGKQAMSAVNAGRPDARRWLESLDSLLLTGPPGQREEYNLAASYLLEATGSPARALAAARRRSYDWDAAWFVATYRRQEGRLAELTGDREGAIAAYSHYLKLREDPEPPLVAQRDSVRAAWARLTGER